MQSVYLAQVNEAVVPSADSDSNQPMKLIEFELTLTPQATYYAHNIYIKMARLLSSKGLLVYPDQHAHNLVILIPQVWNNEKGWKSLFTWLLPLFPKQPPQVKKLSKFSSNWTCLVRATNRSSTQGTTTKQEIEIGQPKEWTIELATSKTGSEEGVSDAIIQACLSYTVSLELNRQGWALCGGRFIRIPAGFKPDNINAIQLTLTLTQQKELSIFVNVTTVKFNSIISHSADAGDLNVVERLVKVLPELNDGQIAQAVGIATTTNSKSLGVDREVWLEKYGINLPPTFPVVQVQLGIDEFTTSTVTVPLCCCLTSDLHPITIRSRDEATKTKQAQEHTATIQEVITILKSIRIIAPTTGSLTPFFTSFQPKETDPLLASINPFTKASSLEMIQSDIGFKSAKELASSTSSSSDVKASTKKPTVKLTLGPSKPLAPINLSLAAIKASTQLPTHAASAVASSIGGGFSSASSFFGSSGFSSKEESKQASTTSSMEDLPNVYREDTDVDMKQMVLDEDEGGATKRAEAATPPKKRVAATPPKPTIEPPAKKAKPTAPTTKETKSKPTKDTTKKASASTTSSNTKEKSSSKSTASTAARKKKSSTASKSKVPTWTADFQQALHAEISEDIRKTAEKFKQAMGGGEPTKKETTTPPAAAAPPPTKKGPTQTKLAFAPI